MQQLGFHGGVRAHGQRQGALGLGQATGALDQLVAGLFMTEHLHFPVEIVRQYRSQQKGSIPRLGADGYVVHLCVRLEFSEHAFLRPAAVMEAQRLFGRDRL